MNLLVPGGLALAGLPDALAQFRDTSGIESFLDFDSSNDPVHPAFLCLLAAQSAADGSVHGYSVRRPPLVDHPVSRMGLFEHVSVEGLEKLDRSDPTGDRIPIQHVRDSKALGDIVTDFVPILHASAETASAVAYVLHELFRNVVEHSGSQNGAFICVDRTQAGIVRIGVSDSGIGVFQTIRRSHPADDERRAVALAFEPGVSGSTSRFGGDDRNGGAGLFFMKSIASVSGQSMAMVTGRTLMLFSGASNGSSGEHVSVQPSLEADAAVAWAHLPVHFAGTMVGVDLAISDDTLFDALFAEIRGAYNLNVRTEKKARQRARFT